MAVESGEADLQGGVAQPNILPEGYVPSVADADSCDSLVCWRKISQTVRDEIYTLLHTPLQNVPNYQLIVASFSSISELLGSKSQECIQLPTIQI